MSQDVLRFPVTFPSDDQRQVLSSNDIATDHREMTTFEVVYLFN